MFKNTRNTDRFDIITHIDGSDLYNSALLKKLKDRQDTLEKSYYLLDKSDKSLDIVTSNCYDKKECEGFLMLLNKDDDLNKPYIMIYDDISQTLEGLNI